MSAPLDLAVRALVLLSLAALVTFALRRRPASLTALVWTAALGALLLLPLAGAVVPAWRVAVLPAPPVETTPVARQVHVDEAPAHDVPAPVTSVDSSGPAVAALESVTAPAFAETNQAGMTGKDLGIGLVALVALALLVRLAISHARLARLVRTSRPADDAWTALIADTSRTLGLARPVPVRTSAALSVPAIAGLARPVLMLPAEAGDWHEDLRRAVALHELAHVARRDAAAQLVCQVACALYWYIPLAWYGARRAAALRERASDDLVLAAGVRASAYAESLIGLARHARGADLQPAALSMARPSRMRERVVAILDPSARRGAPRRPAVATLLAGACAVLVALAAVHPIAAAVEPAPFEPGVTVQQISTVGTARAADADDPASRPMTSTTPSAPAVAPAVAPAALAPPQSASQGFSGPCASDNLDSNSISMSNDDGKREWKMTLRGSDCRVDVRAEGTFEFNDDFTDVARVSRGGFFRLDVTENGVRRQLEIDDAGTREWRVDGRSRPWDDEGRRWLASFLVELDRRTAVGVDVRLPALLRQGGVSAVLDETARMGGDYARSIYYGKLAQATSLSEGDVTRVLDQAASLSKSDFYAHEVIKAFASRGPANDAQRAAIVRIIDGMDSDFYKSESVKRLVAGTRALGAAEVAFLVGVAADIDSDFYQHEVLRLALARGRLDAEGQARVGRAIATIDGDFYASESLRALAASGPLGVDARRAYLAAVERIDSAHYASEALRALLAQDGLSEADLLAIVAATDGMSDHYGSETLRRTLRHRAATARVREAAIAAASGMSRHYRQEVERAAGRG